MAADRAYLRRVVFPTLFGIFTDVIPVAPVHCACVEREGRGLLLTGASGSGKSTLSLALAQQGFGFLSDEWTYFSWREGRLLAWGLPVPLKLLPDARRHFPELARVEPEVSLNGEMAYEIEPESVFGVRRSGSAEPDWLIFLERQNTPSFSLSRVSPIEAATEFEELVGYFAAHRLSEGRDRLVRTIEDFGRISCWRLRYGGQPAAVAGALSEFLDSEDRAARPAERFSSAFAWNRMAPDFLRRSTPTALVADLHVMGHAVRLETNSVTLLQYARRALERHTGAQCPSPEFLWRLVSEPDTGFKTPCREMAAFSDRASSLVSFGQGSFIAVDLETREAVGFLEEKFTKDELEFVRLVLAALLTWTAPAIGLTCDQAASVNQEVLESLSLGHAGDS